MIKTMFGKTYSEKLKEIRENSSIGESERAILLQNLKKEQSEKKKERQRQKGERTRAKNLRRLERKGELANNASKSISDHIHDFNSVYDVATRSSLINPEVPTEGELYNQMKCSFRLVNDPSRIPSHKTKNIIRIPVRKIKYTDVRFCVVLFSFVMLFVYEIQGHPNIDDSDVEEGVMSINKKFSKFCERRPKWHKKYQTLMKKSGQQLNTIKPKKKKRKKRKKRHKHKQAAET